MAHVGSVYVSRVGGGGRGRVSAWGKPGATLPFAVGSGRRLVGATAASAAARAAGSATAVARDATWIDDAPALCFLENGTP